MLGFGRRIRRTRQGDFQVRLSEGERNILRPLPAQLRELLEFEQDDESLRRLFPPAYADQEHAEHEAEYRRLMRDDLLERRLRSLDVLEQTVDAERLDEEQMTAWLTALNDLRLVLGTRLDVSEESAGNEIDPDDPDATAMAVYGYLGWLQEQVVEALM